MDITRTRILLAALPAADWAQANPVLGLGEPAFETDTGFLRIGDGTSRFLELKVHGAYDEITDAAVAAATAAQAAAEQARDEAADAAEAAQAAAEADEPPQPVTARHWRVANLGGAKITAREMEFRDRNGTRLPGTVSASSQVSVYEPGNAYDRNGGTWWEGATTDPDKWFAIDLGAGNQASVGAIYWQSHNSVGPDASFVLQHSDDGSVWTDAGTVEHDGAWVAGQKKVFDASGYTHATRTTRDVAVQEGGHNVIGAATALNFEGVGFTIAEGPEGQATITLDSISGVVVQFAGTEVASEATSFDFTGNVTVSDLGSGGVQVEVVAPSDSIKARYWRAYSLGSGRRAAREIEFRDLEGAKLAGTVSASTERLGNDADHAYDENDGTYWEAGTSEADAWFAIDLGAGNDAVVGSLWWKALNTLGPVNEWDLEYSHDGSTWHLAKSVDEPVSWASDVTHEYDVSDMTGGTYDGLAARVALDRALGGANWRQSIIQMSERATGAWTAGSDVIVIPTMPVELRSGVVGTVRVDVDPGSDVGVEIRDESDVTVATGTITSGSRSADLTAAADATISEEVKLHVIDGPGAATRIDLALRVVAS